MNLEELAILIERNKRIIKLVAYFALGVIFVVLLIIMLLYFFGPDQNNNDDDKSRAYLPEDLVLDENDGLNGDELNGIKAEDIMFGHFYKKYEDNFKPSVPSYSLPTDIKVAAENYYDISRKIDLSNHVDDLNKQGFKIINNPFKDADDFYSVYNKLLSDDIPIIITSDYLMYYYQNNLKNVFDEIERNTFYKNVWDIYKSLYDKASARYVERLARLGISNDPVLEGQRLETAYLAVVLKLLEPSEDQISEQKSLNNFSKFSMTEADNYDFVVPPYLEKDVEKELQLIRKIKMVERSPIMLYPRDYSVFNVPKEYANDAKLHNFYLATKWLSSLFPLYFRTDECPDCMLDKNDWLINLASASYLAKDLSESQANKNKWAIIYKFISYFTGLRQDLTYLEYHRALESIYGKAYVIENIFARKNFNDIDIYKIQDKIAENKFSEIEGSYTRANGRNSQVGMRMLQEPYWPNDYIFNRLTGKEIVSNAVKVANKNQSTSCGNYRCNSTALDIINLQVPLDNVPKFVQESSYAGYNNEVNKLRDYMRGFNVYTWNSNIYWSSLDIIYSSLKEDRSSFLSYMKSNEWFVQKELNSALGTWTNIHLPKDIITNLASDQKAFSSMRPICDLPNFVEPKIGMLYENMSRNNMLLEMMDVLNVSRDSNSAALDLQDVNSKFERLIEINKKILSGSLMTYGDCSYIEGLVNNKMMTDASNKSYRINNGYDISVTENLNGVKLLVAMFAHGDDNIIAIGPVFDYAEGVRKK